MKIVSQFAGEPTLDAVGHLYSIHHCFRANMTMIEAGIYAAYRTGAPVAALVHPGAPISFADLGLAASPALVRRTE